MNEEATKDKVVKYLSNLISDQALRGAPMLEYEGRIEEEADFIIRLAKKELGEKLNVLKYIRQETCCGLAEANDALMKLIKVLKEHPMRICDRPHTLKIEWEEKQ